jgi:hypothetical protein
MMGLAVIGVAIWIALLCINDRLKEIRDVLNVGRAALSDAQGDR